MPTPTQTSAGDVVTERSHTPENPAEKLPEEAVAEASTSESRPALRERIVSLVKRHPWLVGLLGVGVALRAAIAYAYGPAFYFSDTRGYFEYAEWFRPSQIRPYGYSALLNLFQPTGSVWPVIITHNLLGLACGVAVYAFVLRKGGARWLAVVAAAPIVLDGYALVLEHYLLADTLFTFLLLLGFIFLMWQDKLTVAFAAIAGVLLAGALLTRTVGVPLVALVGIYVLVRRVGWRPFVALSLAAGVPLIGYLMWFHHFNGVYSFSTWQDRWAYGRVMSIADCDNLKLDANTRPLCQRTSEVGYAYDVDFYVWSHNSPVVGVKRKYIYQFVGEVIKQQPGDYSRLVARESWAYFSPGFYLHREQPTGTTCPQIWQFHSSITEPGCSPRPVANSRWGDHPGEVPEEWRSAPTSFFAGYSKWITVPGPALLACLLLVIAAWAAPLARRSQPVGAHGRRLRWDMLLLAASGLALVVGAVATSQFDIRYGIPIVTLLPMAGALGCVSLRTAFGRVHEASPASDAAQPGAPKAGIKHQHTSSQSSAETSSV